MLPASIEWYVKQEMQGQCNDMMSTRATHLGDIGSHSTFHCLFVFRLKRPEALAIEEGIVAKHWMSIERTSAKKI